MKFREKIDQFRFKVNEAVGKKEIKEGPISPVITKGVVDAINNRWNITISYLPVDGVKKVLPSTYIVQPYCYGLNRYSKNHILRAYVLNGSGFDGFVTFRLDRILTLVADKSKTFDEPVGEWTGSDNLMSQQLEVVEFPK